MSGTSGRCCGFWTAALLPSHRGRQDAGLAVALARELRPPVHLGQPLSYNLLISPETKSPLFAKNVEHRVLGEEDN